MNLQRTEDLLAQKACHGNGKEEDWRTVLRSLHQAGFGDQTAELLFLNVSCARELDCVVRWMDESSEREGVSVETLFIRMAQQVNESSQSLDDWIEGLTAFREWLDERGRRARFSHALGFLECCSSVCENRAPFAQLRAVVIEMLDEYGYEGDPE